jgi:hypothetical protein
MHRHTPCPAVEDYEEMLRGRLSSWGVIRLTDHLERCDLCAAGVQHLRSGDTLLQIVRRAQAAAAELPGDEWETRLIEQVCAHRLQPAAGRLVGRQRDRLRHHWPAVAGDRRSRKKRSLVRLPALDLPARDLDAIVPSRKLRFL